MPLFMHSFLSSSLPFSVPSFTCAPFSFPDPRHPALSRSQFSWCNFVLSEFPRPCHSLSSALAESNPLSSARVEETLRWLSPLCAFFSALITHLPLSYHYYSYSFSIAVDYTFLPAPLLLLFLLSSPSSFLIFLLLLFLLPRIPPLPFSSLPSSSSFPLPHLPSSFSATFYQPFHLPYQHTPLHYLLYNLISFHCPLSESTPTELPLITQFFVP